MSVTYKNALPLPQNHTELLLHDIYHSSDLDADIHGYIFSIKGINYITHAFPSL